MGGDAAWEAARAARQAFEEGGEGSAAVPGSAGAGAVRPGSTGAGAASGGTGGVAVPGSARSAVISGATEGVAAPGDVASPSSGELGEARPASGGAAEGVQVPRGDGEDAAGADNKKGAGLLDSVDNPLLVKQAKLREVRLHVLLQIAFLVCWNRPCQSLSFPHCIGNHGAVAARTLGRSVGSTASVVVITQIECHPSRRIEAGAARCVWSWSGTSEDTSTCLYRRVGDDRAEDATLHCS